MPLRPSVLILALLAFVPVVVSRPLSSPTSTLRIEAMGPRRLQVELTSTPPGLFLDSARTAGALPKLVVMTPAVVAVADSVRTLRVVVQGWDQSASYLTASQRTPSPPPRSGDET